MLPIVLALFVKMGCLSVTYVSIVGVFSKDAIMFSRGTGRASIHFSCPSLASSRTGAAVIYLPGK